VLHEYFARLALLAGIAIIVMGLHFLGVFRFAFLYREARIDVQKPLGIWGAYVMGMAFGFGWTPCIGPILAAILAVAASQETIGRGIMLLAVYSGGLGLPFLLVALAIEPFLRFINRFRPYFGAFERVIGVLLVTMGIAFLSGSIQDLSAWLLQRFPGLANFG
jgi:cytochrome c-type biogenesis protein